MKSLLSGCTGKLKYVCIFIDYTICMKYDTCNRTSYNIKTCIIERTYCQISVPSLLQDTLENGIYMSGLSNHNPLSKRTSVSFMTV